LEFGFRVCLCAKETRTLLRPIDANLNRASEGLRVLEDIARFVLNDAPLTEWLKSLRHELLRASSTFQMDLLNARAAIADVGASIEAVGEGERQDLCSIAIANSRRVQEALRVLEEFAKLPSSPLRSDAKALEQIRFAMYDLEQHLVGLLTRRQQAARLAGLYVIIDVDFVGWRDPVAVAKLVLEGGAAVVQLRDKKGPQVRTLNMARDIRLVCAEKGVLFIVNDCLDVALATCADGLHVGQEDLPVSEARRLLPIGALVGCSASEVEEALKAQADGADYVAVGAMYPTASKEDYNLAGLKVLREVREKVPLPLVAIGGINEANVEEVVAAGADSVAVISAVLQAEDVEGATRRLASRINEVRERLGKKSKECSGTD